MVVPSPFLQFFVNSPMAGGGGGEGVANPKKLFLFSPEWREQLFQGNFLAVGTSLGHLIMKNFSDTIYRLGSIIRQREGAKGWQAPPPPHGLNIYLFFLTMKMTLSLNRIMCGVKIHCQKKFHDNAIKDNVTVTSLNFS